MCIRDRDKSDKTDEILGALRNRMKFTRQFYNVTDDSFPGRTERGRSEFVPFVIDAASDVYKRQH